MIRSGYDLIMHNSVIWAVCDSVQSKYIKCLFHICSHGRGKQQPEEGGREVEVALGFRWNWRKTGADACIYVHTLTCGSSHGPHMDTSALMLTSPNLTTSEGWDGKVLELCCLLAVNCNHVTCQKTPDRTFGAGAIARVRLCGHAERQILSVNNTGSSASLFFNVWISAHGGSRTKMQIAVNRRTGVGGYSEMDAAVQNTANQ